jgi:hypothetical protein
MPVARLAGTSLELVDPASLSVFRIAFGGLLLVETVRFFVHGWIGDHYLVPELLFTYPGFGWVRPWPGDLLYWHVGLMGACAALIAAGFFYRIAAAGFLLTFAYLFLLDQATYLNQYVLVLSVAFILCVVPAARGWSVDARRAGSAAPAGVPRWAVWTLRLQFEVMLLSAGLVKLNGDWLRGEPLGSWLAAHAGLPVVGDWLQLSSVAVASAWAVVALHLGGGLLLLHRRYRLAVFLVYAGFHLVCALLFQIGLFPWLTLAGTLVFFDADWPRQVWARLDGTPVRAGRPGAVSHAGAPAVATRLALGIFFVLQIVMPWRFLAYPGHVAWTGRGEWFAWRMLLDDKRADARFIVLDADTQQRWEVTPGDHLRPRQLEMMAPRPDLILQFARHLERLWVARDGVRDVEVRAVVMASLNGRPAAPLIDPGVDLTRVPRWSLRIASGRDWILPRPTTAPARITRGGP